MSHCIHAIVAPDPFADVISQRWPELPRLRHETGFSIFPVEYDLIDAKITPTVTTRETDEEFMLLTPAFEDYLRELSAGGILAYIETEYFGGVGGQGGLVFQNKSELMKPVWEESDTINRALEIIGVPRPSGRDRFSVIGFDDVRDNDGILGQIETQMRG